MRRALNCMSSASAILITSLATTFAGLAAAQSSRPHRMEDMQSMPGMEMPGEKPKEAAPADRSGSSERPGADPPISGRSSPDMPRDHGQVKHDSSMPGMQGGDSGMKNMPGMQQDSMPQMEMGPMQGGRPPADARDPDAYAGGMPRMPMPGMDMADDQRFGRVLVNELEYSDGRRDRGQNLDLEAWYGGDYNKLWLKAEGERRGGRLDTFQTEALWDHTIAAFWSTQVGLRHDTGLGPTRNWLAFGVQGLAPYWFETEATAYVGSRGTLAARVEVRYEVLFTQRLILQPRLEANFYSKNDPERGIGSGLSDLEVGVRLRYEVTRHVAPYIGVVWMRKFGNTAAYARQAGERVRDTQLVAGVRLWF